MPSKPEAMVIYEQMQTLGVPLIGGGLLDQPHIFMQEMGVVRDKMEMWTVVREQQQRIQDDS